MTRLLSAAVVLLALSFSSHAQTAMEDSFFLPLVTCKSVIDSVPFTLDVFEQYESESEKPTGNGYIVQTMGEPSGPSFKSLARITLQSPKEGVKTVDMYAVLEPQVRFARFEINLQKSSKVEIYAENFRAVWGTFDCRPVGL